MASFTLNQHTPTPSGETTMSSHVIQATSAQDMAWNGKAADGSFEFVAVSDSHGRLINKKMIMDIITKIDWTTFLLQDDWQSEFIKLTSGTTSYRVGATFTLFKIYPDRFECNWIGDSTGKIYSGETLVWQTVDHDNQNEEEIARLRDQGFVIKGGWDIAPKNPDMLLSKRSKIFTQSGESISLCRSLGHTSVFMRGLSSLGIVTKVIERNTDQKYKIVAGTDGLWGMVSISHDTVFLSNPASTSEEIASFASERWNKSWDWDNSIGDIQKNVSLPKDNIDDVGVSVWTNVN